MSNCKSCEEALVLLSGYDDDDESMAYEEVPDDVALLCGCHYHW